MSLPIYGFQKKASQRKEKPSIGNTRDERSEVTWNGVDHKGTGRSSLYSWD
jgi:hypothetical protein